METIKKYRVVTESFLGHRLNKSTEELLEHLDYLRNQGCIHRDLGNIFFVRDL